MKKEIVVVLLTFGVLFSLVFSGKTQVAIPFVIQIPLQQKDRDEDGGK